MRNPRCSRCDQRSIGYFEIPYTRVVARKKRWYTKRWHVCFEDMKRLSHNGWKFVPLEEGRAVNAV